MFDFVPIEDYYRLYINTCLIVVVMTFFHTRILSITDSRNIGFINIIGFLMMVFTILYVGQRPISSIFGDTVNYLVSFNNYKYGLPIDTKDDIGWHVFMKFFAPNVSIHTFYTFVSFLYIYPMYRISKFYFGNLWHYAFLMFIVSFSFWSYGVNGIRNGVACSFFLWGLSFRNKKTIMGLFFIIAILFHKTLYLPVLAYVITYLYNNPKSFFIGWLACIPLSLLFGGIWIILFANLGFGDDRLSSYLTSQAETGTFSRSGFRWDFLFHSAFAVFAGWYFIFKKKFKDPVYFQLLNTYLICNGFWILVINANYSNRFAYLSWFMMAIVIIYPFLKKNFFKNQHAIMGNVIMAYFGFTYIMYYVYYN